MMPVLSSVSVKSLRVGKTFQSGITYTLLGPAAMPRASGRGHVSISHAHLTRLPEETSAGFFQTAAAKGDKHIWNPELKYTANVQK